ncbi:MAG: hypothetical protein IPN29_14440 [Saprospiraceae bacterium]|nr:hypothetical protein [Saprospiraceae bacterium]
MFQYFLSNRDKLEKMQEVAFVRDRIFSGSTIKAVSNYMSTLMGWLEEWIMLEQILSEKHTGDLTLIKWYNCKGIFQQTNKVVDRIKKRIELNDAFSLEDIKAKAKMLDMLYYSNSTIKDELGGVLLDDLVTAYAQSQKVQSYLYLTEMLSWGKIKGYDYTEQITRLESMSNLIPSPPKFEVTESMYDMKKQMTRESVEAMASHLFNGKISPHETFHTLYCLYISLAAVDLSNKGQPLPEDFVLAINEYCLRTGVFDEDGKLSTLTFHNLVMRLSATTDFEKVDDFISRWYTKVNTKNHEATKALAEAQNLFYHGFYEEMISKTWRSDFEFFHQKNMAMCFHCIAFFMKRHEEPELYKTAITSFAASIKRNRGKMSEKVNSSYLNLVDFMLSYDNEKIDTIDLGNYKNLIFRRWCGQVLEKRRVPPKRTRR